MIETLITIGYWSAGIGLVACIAGYFIFPGLIKKAFESEENT